MNTNGRMAFPIGFLAALAISTSALGAPPAAPTNLHVSCIPTTASLQWQDNSNNETFFRIWRRPPGGVWGIIHQAPADTVNWADLNFSANPISCYKVEAHNIDGFSDSPAEVCVPTLSEPALTSPANGHVFQAGTDAVTLVWNPAPNANRYSVRLGGANCAGMGQIAQIGATQWTVTELVNGTYSWGVVSMYTNGATGSSVSDFTQCSTFTIGSSTQDTENPIVIITLPTTNSTHLTPNSEIELRGTASDNVGVTQVRWSNTTTDDSGICTGLNSWSTFRIPLQPGDNNFTVTARDAANNTGIDEITVTYAPPPGLATVTIANITSIGGDSADCGGNVTDQGTSNVTLRGVCWNTTGYPNTGNSKTADGAGAGLFESHMSGLSPGTTYYVRAYAVNAVGAAYSSQSMFSTIPASGILPTVTIASVINITQTGAECGGNVTAEGGSPVIARGVCWNTSGSPTIDNSKTTNGSGLGGFTSNLNGLLGNTTYYLRAYATNSAGTGYSNPLEFTTTPAPRFSLTLLPNPLAGGTVAAFPLPSNGGYLSGTIVTLTATPFVGYYLGSWSGGVTGINNPTTIVMYENRTVAANFGSTPSSNMASFSGRVTDSATGTTIGETLVQWGESSGLTDLGGAYAFNAVPCQTNELRVTRTGYVTWSEPYSPPCDQNNSKNIALTRTKVNLSVLLGNDGSGRAKVNGTLRDLPWSGVLDHGTAITIEASPASGWVLDYWERNGADLGDNSPHSFVITADTSATAHYKREPVTDAPGAQSPPCGALGNCGATGIMTLAISFIGMGLLRKRRTYGTQANIAAQRPQDDEGE